MYEFLILGSISFILDIKSNDCIKKSKYKTSLIYLNLYFHHLLNVFLNYGWISDDPVVLKIYLVLPLFVLLHWKTNNEKCAVTQHANYICGNPDEEYLHDILYLLGIKNLEYYNVIQGIILLGGMLIAVRKLLK